MRDFLLGSDPELRLKGAAADRVLEMSRDFGMKQKVGVDGHPSTMEIRPSPRYTPRAHVEEILRVIKGGIEKYPQTLKYKWLAGAMQDGEAIGGHIHFNVPFQDFYSPVFDKLLAVPVLMMENPLAAAERRQRYGKSGDIRPQPWGFEYRVLPSWILSKGISLAVLSLAKVVMDQLLKKDRENFLKAVKKLPFNESSFRSCEKSFFKKSFDDTWNLIKTLPLYPAYKNELALIPWVCQKKKQWKDDRNILEGWRIVNTKKAVVAVEQKKELPTYSWEEFSHFSVTQMINELNVFFEAKYGGMYECHTAVVNKNDLGYKQMGCYLKPVRWLFPITFLGAKKERGDHMCFLPEVFRGKEREIREILGHVRPDVQISFEQFSPRGEIFAASRNLRGPEQIEYTINLILLIYAIQLELVRPITPFSPISPLFAGPGGVSTGDVRVSTGEWISQPLRTADIFEWRSNGSSFQNAYSFSIDSAGTTVMPEPIEIPLPSLCTFQVGSRTVAVDMRFVEGLTEEEIIQFQQHLYRDTAVSVFDNPELLHTECQEIRRVILSRRTPVEPQQIHTISFYRNHRQIIIPIPENGEQVTQEELNHLRHHTELTLAGWIGEGPSDTEINNFVIRYQREYRQQRDRRQLRSRNMNSVFSRRILTAEQTDRPLNVNEDDDF